MIIEDRIQFEDVKGYKFGYKKYGIPVLFTHIFYIDGLLIDTGQSKASQSVLDTVSELDIEQVLITHHLEDHTGNLNVLRDELNCSFFASDLCCQMMKDPPSLSLAQKLTWGDRPSAHFLKPISGSICTPNYEFQLIPISGHAIDMMALYEPNKRWLFSADLYINSTIGFF